MKISNIPLMSKTKLTKIQVNKKEQKNFLNDFNVFHSMFDYQNYYFNFLIFPVRMAKEVSDFKFMPSPKLHKLYYSIYLLNTSAID